MKLTWQIELPQWLLIAAMWIAAAAAWPSAPERMPIHWGLDGRPDGWGGRFVALLFLPILATGSYVLLLVLPRLDPGRANYGRFAGAYQTIRLCAVGVVAALYALMHLSFRGVPVDMSRAVFVVVGAMLIALGNVLGKVRPNWFVGVRTPWTLSSKTSWVKSHRLAGWVMVLGGAVFVPAGLSGSMRLQLVAAAALLGGMIAVIIYSYVIWKRDPDKIPPVGTMPAENG